jgi:four helix bundle protein
MKLHELRVYQHAMDVGERIWALVSSWDTFAKDTMGKQLIRSADSVAANLSEGFGRFFYKENRRLCYYSRGSLYETFTWIEKAHNRGLISKSDYEALRRDLGVIAKMLNKYIRSIGREGTPSKDILPPMTDDH